MGGRAGRPSLRLDTVTSWWTARLLDGVAYQRRNTAVGFVDGIAAGVEFFRERDDVAAGPGGGLAHGIVCAEDLGTALHHGIAIGGAVGAALFGV